MRSWAIVFAHYVRLNALTLARLNETGGPARSVQTGVECYHYDASWVCPELINMYLI